MDRTAPIRAAGHTRVAAVPGRAPARLRSGRDIDRVFDEGAAAHSRYLSVHCVPRAGQPTRAAVVAGRKVGGAVQRNRAKRRLRAALREAAVPEGHDVVVVARARTLDVAFPDLQAVLAERLRTCARHAHTP